MLQIKSNQAFIKIVALITLCLTTFGFTSRYGLDSYEIYLNKKLILKQTVNQPLSLRTLQLNKAKPSDQLRINYIHCMTKSPGSDRTISLKNDKGNIVKKWTFANSSDFNMVIPIKELIQLEKTHTGQTLSLHYTARELQKSEMLAALQ